MRKKVISHKVLALGLPLLMYGCGSPTHLAFHQNTVFGVDVAVSPETNNVKAAVGYDRNTIALIPTSKLQTEEGSTKNQAMSVVGLTKIKVPWFSHQSIKERFATGQAARNLVKDKEGMRKFLEDK